MAHQMSMKALPAPFTIDQTLTPESAGQRGYVLVCDVFPSFVVENQELITTLLAEGCVLGVGSTGNHDDAVGLYQLVVRQEQH